MASVVTMAVAMAAFSGPPASAMDKGLREGVMEAVVFIMAFEPKGSHTIPVSSGSGSVIDPSGIILTNYHVIYDLATDRPHYLVRVDFTKRGAWDKRPTPTCIADPDNAFIDKRNDLALIKCETDADMSAPRPIPAGKKFPYLKMGTSGGIVPGDDVSIIGYPGIGGETINFTAGKIAGWLGPDGKAGKEWLKTDAIIAGGNSGGAALDDDGKLIGIPTRIGDLEMRGGATIGQINYLRPVDFASTLRGASLTKKWDPLKDGSAAIASKTSGKSDKSGRYGDDGGGGGGGGGGSGHSAGKRDPAYKGIDVYPDDGVGPSDDGADDAPGPRPGPGKGPAPSHGDDGVTVVGRLMASDTGKPVGGGIVLFIMPGVRVKGLTDSTLPRSVYTKAIADGKGYFETERPLARGASYGVVVLAKGFEPVAVDDGVSIGDGPDRFDVGNVELARD
jgi:S1-C subfamily serine protease